MREITVEMLLEGINNNINFDFKVVDGMITFTGFVGKKAMRSKYGDRLLVQLGSLLNVTPVFTEVVSQNGFAYNKVGIPVKGMKTEDIEKYISLLNQAMSEYSKRVKESK